VKLYLVGQPLLKGDFMKTMKLLTSAVAVNQADEDNAG
jgi:hypothetical protein